MVTVPSLAHFRRAKNKDSFVLHNFNRLVRVSSSLAGSTLLAYQTRHLRVVYNDSSSWGGLGA